MSVSIAIHPLSDSIDMYGEPDTASAYSLSGHISISQTSTSLFDNRRSVDLLLQSLVITFEGQSELISPHVGYVPLRICSVTRDLASNEPMELRRDGHEGPRKPCSWNVVFNLPIPGWIPASSNFGDENGGTRYSLSATANFANLDDGRSWLFSTLCSPLRSRNRIARAEKCDIVVNRFINPPGIPLSPNSPFTTNIYAVNARPAHIDDPRDATHIPLEVLSKIKVLVSVPEYASLDASSVPFGLRLRTENLDNSECKRLQIIGFTVELEQLEHYRAIPSTDYASHYPIPPSSQQPPSKPLLNPHPLQIIHELGFLCVPHPSRRISRSISMHPPSFSNRYVLSGETYIFSEDGEPGVDPTWYTMETDVPFSHIGHTDGEDLGEGKLRPSGNTPLFCVQHILHVSLTCSYDIPHSSGKAVEQLHFSIPIRFVSITPPPARAAPSALLSSTAPLLAQGTMNYAIPHSLPAYSQLFDSNGERKIDYSTPLPMYEPRSPASSSLDLSERKELLDELLPS